MINTNLKRQILASDIEIAYIDEGAKTKPTLLFIHGLANYWQVWQSNIEELKNNFRCIAIDLPGNGFSSRGNYAFDFDFYTNVIFQFIEALKLKNLTLVGHSLGGHIACKMALSNSPKIKSLILFAPSGFEFYDKHQVVLSKSMMKLGQMLNMDESHLSQSIRSSFFKHSPNIKKITDELIQFIQKNDRSLYQKMIERSMNAMLDEPIFQNLSEISLPTLVFFGERDELIPNRFFHHKTTREIAVLACNQMQMARLITYPETGHFVQIEQSAKVNSEIEHFMTRI